MPHDVQRSCNEPKQTQPTLPHILMEKYKIEVMTAHPTDRRNDINSLGK
jgi:chaperonin cofactor prefoldin